MLKRVNWCKELRLLEFIVPAIMFAVCFYWLVPFLSYLGLHEYYSYMLGMGIPLFILGLAAIVSKPSLEGLGVHKISLRDLFIVLATFIFSLLGFFVMSTITDWLMNLGVIRLPDVSIFSLPSNSIDILVEEFGDLKGNWLFLFFHVVLLFINIVGEELWWRGVVLPRQMTLKYGFIIHALLWTLFHAYKYWDLLNLLPMSIGLTFVYFKTRNTSATMLFHTITNGVGVVIMFLMVLGV